MKGLSRKIFTSILALILTGAALGTGVFAWFTINNTATANGFEGTVEAASGGFMVSKTGAEGSWATSVTLDDVFSGEFSDLTTVDGINFVKKDGTEAKAGQYVEFDLHFAAGAFTNIEATLDITGNSTTWTPDYQGSTEGPVTDFASNAVRVSFQQNTLVTVFEKAAGTDGNTAGIGEFSKNKAVQYYNKVNPGGIKEADFGKAGEGVAYVSNIANTVHTGAANVATLGTPSGVTLPEDGYTTYAKVTVRVWIEGWDQEAYNAILTGKVNIDFSFKAK